MGKTPFYTITKFHSLSLKPPLLNAFQMERLNLSSNRIGDRGMWKLYRSIHNIDFLDVSWCRISASCKDDVRSRLVRDEFSVRHVKG